MVISRGASRHRRAIVAAYVLGVMALMFLPEPPSPSSLPGGLDKLVHLVLFLGLGALLYWDRLAAGRRPTAQVITAAVATAGLVELVQAVLPYRSGDAWDFGASVVGAVGGVVLARWMLRPR